MKTLSLSIFESLFFWFPSSCYRNGAVFSEKVSLAFGVTHHMVVCAIAALQIPVIQVIPDHLETT